MEHRRAAAFLASGDSRVVEGSEILVDRDQAHT
jgi:hypothetical protein